MVCLFPGRFLVAPSSYMYMKLVRAVYRQNIYYYLVQFSGMLHCWLQRSELTVHPSYIWKKTSAYKELILKNGADPHEMLHLISVFTICLCDGLHPSQKIFSHVRPFYCHPCLGVCNHLAKETSWNIEILYQGYLFTSWKPNNRDAA